MIFLPDDPGKSLNRPLKAPENFDWQSEYGLLVQGTDLGRQKNYAEAEGYLRKASGKEPGSCTRTYANGTDNVPTGII